MKYFLFAAIVLSSTACFAQTPKVADKAPPKVVKRPTKEEKKAEADKKKAYQMQAYAMQSEMMRRQAFMNQVQMQMWIARQMALQEKASRDAMDLSSSHMADIEYMERLQKPIRPEPIYIPAPMRKPESSSVDFYSSSGPEFSIEKDSSGYKARDWKTGKSYWAPR